MSVRLTSSTESKEAPADAAFLKELLTNELTKLSEPKVFAQNVVASLGKKSSKHKFIVEVTTVEKKEDFNEDLKITSSVAVVWDPERDGYSTFQIDSVECAPDSSFIVTLFWNYVD